MLTKAERIRQAEQLTILNLATVALNKQLLESRANAKAAREQVDRVKKLHNPDTALVERLNKYLEAAGIDLNILRQREQVLMDWHKEIYEQGWNK